MNLLSSSEVMVVAERHLRIDPKKKPYGLGRQYTLLSVHDSDHIVRTNVIAVNIYHQEDFKRKSSDAFFADLAIETHVPGIYVFVEKMELMVVVVETAMGQKESQLVRKQDLDKVVDAFNSSEKIQSTDVPPPPPPPPPLRIIREGVKVTQSGEIPEAIPAPPFKKVDLAPRSWLFEKVSSLTKKGSAWYGLKK